MPQKLSEVSEFDSKHINACLYQTLIFYRKQPHVSTFFFHFDFFSLPILLPFMAVGPGLLVS